MSTQSTVGHSVFESMVGQLVNALERIERRAYDGLTSTDEHVLAYVRKHSRPGKGVSTVDIALGVDVSPANLKAAMQRLRTKGFIQALPEMAKGGYKHWVAAS